MIAAVLLGWTRGATLPVTALARAVKLQALHDRLEAGLGAEQLEPLLTEGAQRDVDALLAALE